MLLITAGVLLQATLACSSGKNEEAVTSGEASKLQQSLRRGRLR
jgi:hypothetical protein